MCPGTIIEMGIIIVGPVIRCKHAAVSISDDKLFMDRFQAIRQLAQFDVSTKFPRQLDQLSAAFAKNIILGAEILETTAFMPTDEHG